MKTIRNFPAFITVSFIVLLIVTATIQDSATYRLVTFQRMLQFETLDWIPGFGFTPEVVLEVVPTIMAGESGGFLGDTPEMRVDPNTSTSPYAGVGSLLLQFTDGLFLCSGTAISPRHVLTAAHCFRVDGDGNPGLPPENVNFILNFGGDQTHVIPADAIDIHPGFIDPWNRFDLAVLTLSQDLPPEVPIYGLLREPLPLHSIVTIVGYGRTGDGHTGINWDIPLLGTVKRSGQNVVDFIGRPGFSNENVFFYDFDAPNGIGLNVLGGLSLGNQIETVVSFGDSGGPNFVSADNGSLLIAGVNSVIVHFLPIPFQRFSTFAEGGGGISVPPHTAWIDNITGLSPLSPPANFTLDSSNISTALLSEINANNITYFIEE